ncbi:MAG: hypothetical protein GX574_10395 [Lentisphaerae bacterium]|nr:hypothetical protein [Lentisphaerota bacterium]OQC12234.1 MAG: hypothetical protein BWX73_03069 [Lentisphaerae bacterium ADurb.Bin082]
MSCRKIFGLLAAVLVASALSGYLVWRYVVLFPPLSFQPAPGSGIVEGSFELTIRKPLNPKTLVRYAIPLNPENGRPLPSASTMVFYAPYNGEAARLRQGLVSWHRDFALQQGYSAFSLSIEANTVITADPARYYIYPESGWAALVFRIQKHIAAEFGLELRPLIVIGESSGGSMAQQMAVTFPERIRVAAWNGGSRYAPFSGSSDIRMLALNIWGCPGLERTADMVEEGIEKGFNIRHVVTPPAWNETGRFDQHSTWELSHRLIAAFVLQSPEFERLMSSLPPVDFTEKMMVSFPAPKDASKHVIFLGNQGKNDLFLKNLMWDAFHRQVAASAVRCADTPEETAARIQLLLASNPFPELPIVVFATEAIAEPATGISVQVIHEADGWQAALHALAGKPHSGAN